MSIPIFGPAGAKRMPDANVSHRTYMHPKWHDSQPSAPQATSDVTVAETAAASTVTAVTAAAVAAVAVRCRCLHRSRYHT